MDDWTTGGGNNPLNHNPRKAALRKLMLRRRAALGAALQKAHSNRIHDRIWNIPALGTCRNLHCYLSFGNEVSTERIFQTCHGSGVAAFAPYQMPGKSLLGSAPWKPGDEIVLGPMNVPQPNPRVGIEKIDATARIRWDAILVPGLAFDRQGSRVGYGKGFYDRLLKEIVSKEPQPRRGEERTADTRSRELASQANRPITIGLAFSLQMVDRLPSEPWDMPLDIIVTENETIICA